jgi:hypothetical protein
MLKELLWINFYSWYTNFRGFRGCQQTTNLNFRRKMTIWFPFGNKQCIPRVCMFINHKMTHRYIYLRFTWHALQLHHVTMLNYLHGYKRLCCQNLAMSCLKKNLQAIYYIIFLTRNYLKCKPLDIDICHVNNFSPITW